MKKLKKMIVAVITMVMMSTSFIGLAIQASAENATEATAVPTSVPTATLIRTDDRVYNRTETYPNAHYTFYTDDLRSSYEFLMVNYNRIINYDIVIESDGTASYTYVKSNLYPNVDASNTEEALKAVKTSLADKDFRYSSFKNQTKNKHVQDAFLSNNGAVSDCMRSLGKQDNAQ